MRSAECGMKPVNTPNYLKVRTKQFALQTIRLVDSLPKSMVAQVIGRQLLRSALSVAANYRAACRARSKPDFASKLGIVEEETDECLYWMEMLTDAKVTTEERLAALMKEANEIEAMVVASIRTVRAKPR